MNETVNKFLLVGDKLLRQPGLKVLIDHLLKKRIEKFKETGDSRYIYQNKHDRTFMKENQKI